jgi:hypothetical protein
MAFKSNINYVGYQGQRGQAERDHTKALYVKKKEDEAEARRAAAAAAAAATRRSGQRSGLQKLGSAALRAGAAYYTGGASEALGFGGAIDDVVLGKDDQGNSIRNEYGEIVRAGSGIYGAMKARKAGDVARKRGSNVQDYEEQVRLATEMGKLDPKQGARMLTEAQSLRSRQQAQTQSGEDASLWGWDNEFDDLELSPAQIAGAKEADARILPTGAGRQIDESSAMEGATMGETQTARNRRLDDERLLTANRAIDRSGLAPTTSEVERMYERDRRASDLLNIREDAMGSGATGESRRDYRVRLNDELMDERSAEKLLDYDPALETTTTKFKGSPISKTYLEKAALESDRDFNAQDKISDQLDEAKLLKKTRGTTRNKIVESDLLKGFLPQSLRDPRIVEAELMQRRMEENARKRRQKEIERMSFRSGEQYNPYESPLLKRMRAKRKAGSVLHR